jgi:hypothetical protein
MAIRCRSGRLRWRRPRRGYSANEGDETLAVASHVKKFFARNLEGFIRDRQGMPVRLMSTSRAMSMCAGEESDEGV